MRPAPRSSSLLASLFVGCGGASAAPDAAPAPRDAGRDGAPEAHDEGSAADASAADTSAVETSADAPFDDVGPDPIRVTIEAVTDQHRFVPGAMFGGWGPHLGHLVRAGGTHYWVDDLCDQRVAGDCDVNVNRRVGVLRREGGVWTPVATHTLSGVQQNTGTIASADTLFTYGVDVTAGRVSECRFEIATGLARCAAVSIPTGPSANYVGAAIAPDGSRLAWWTNVVDGGGGSFSYIVDYGGGWNGPRTGPIGGYNDFAYAHAGFVHGAPDVIFFGQVVAGLAPAWTFATLVGEASLSTTDAVDFASALAAPAGDAIVSTNDLWVDPAGGDAHLLARAESGAVVYYHRARGGRFGAPTVLPPAGFRARFLESPSSLAIVTGASDEGMIVRRFARTELTVGRPLPIERAAAEWVPVPIGRILAIYPEADVTQHEPVGELAFGVVGSDDENVVRFLSLE